MGPLDFLKQKLQQGLSTVENWGSDAGNDITHAVGALFGTNAPQPKQPTVVQQPQTNRSALPPQLQPQNQPANPAQQQLPKPIQLQDQQPNSVPLFNFSAPKPTNNAIKIAQPTAQVAPPKVAPVKIANNQPSPFVQKLVSGQLKSEQPQFPRAPLSPAQKIINAGLDTAANFAAGTAELAGNTIQSLTVDPARMIAAGVTGDKKALQEAARSEIQHNLFTPAVPFAQDVATAVVSPYAEHVADQEADRARKELAIPGASKEYNDWIEAYASGVKQDILNQHLNTAGVDMNTPTSDVAKKTLVDALNATTPLALGDLIRVPAGSSAAASSELGASRILENPEAEAAGEQIQSLGSHTPEQLSVAHGQPIDVGPPPSIENQLSREALEGSKEPAGVHSFGNGITNAEDVNGGFPARDIEAETVAHEAYANTGSLEAAVKAYQNVSGADSLTALTEASRSLQEAGKLPLGEDDISKIMAPVNIPDNTPDAIAKEAKRLESSFLYRNPEASSLDELLGKARGRSTEFRRMSDRFSASIRNNLSPEERQAVRDILEGSAKKDEITPKAQAVADIAKQFNEKGLNVLQLARPETERVANYATRLYNGPRLAEEAANPIRVKFDALRDLFSTESRFGQHREIQKFIAKDGEARYGTRSSIGLRNIKGELVDGSGKAFKPVATSTRELTERGGLKFEGDYSKIAHQYNTHIGAVQARYEALQQLLKNPTHYGISDVEGPGMVSLDAIPELRGKYANPNVAKQLLDAFRAPDTRSIPQRIFDGSMSVITQMIVANPTIHGFNQLFQSMIAAGKIPIAKGVDIQGGPAGWVRMGASFVRMAQDPEYLVDLMTQYNRAGGELASYGSRNETLLTKAADGLNLPHFSKANATAMEGIDNTLRMSLFDAQVHAGVDPRIAVKNIEHFMGDTKEAGNVTRVFIMFSHYLRTEGRTLLSVANMKNNYGATLNFALLAAMYVVANKAWQKWTGNPNASIRAPGSLSLVKQATEVPSQIQQGEVPSIISSHINPVVQLGGNLIYGKDLFNGQEVPRTPAGIGNEVLNTAVAPSQYTTKIANGSATPGQEALQFLTGATLPHTKGSPAIPNESNPLAGIVNTPGAKPALGSDATGVQQATQYYKAKNTLTSSLQGDQPALDAANKFLDREKTPQGQTMLSGPQQTASNWSDLASQPKALLATQKMQQSLPSHNPEWDLPSSELATWAVYKSLPPGDLQRDVMLQKNPWISDLEGKISAWGQQQVQSGNTVQSPDYVAYPTLSPDVQQMMNRASQLGGIPPENRTPAEEQELKNLSNNPDLQAAYQQLDQYTNAVRSKWGLPEIQYAPTASPEVQNFTNAYMSADKATRTQLRTQSPELFNQMQTFLAQQSLANVEKKGGEAYYGAPVGGSLLGSIYNLGQYDINRTVNPNGTSSYSINPQAAYASKAAASGSSKKPLVPLPKRPKKNEARVLKLRKSRMSHKVHISKSPRIHIKKEQVLKPVHIGHGGPLKIKNK